MGKGLKGKIQIEGSTIKSLPDGAKQNLLEIHPTSGKSYILSADSTAERDAWIDALQKASRGQFEIEKVLGGDDAGGHH